jgi:hypothetical protein
VLSKTLLRVTGYELETNNRRTRNPKLLLPFALNLAP